MNEKLTLQGVIDQSLKYIDSTIGLDNAEVVVWILNDGDVDRFKESTLEIRVKAKN